MGDQAHLSFTAAFNHDGGPISLECGAESFGDPQTVQLKFPTLLVHSVAAVNPAP